MNYNMTETATWMDVNECIGGHVGLRRKRNYSPEIGHNHDQTHFQKEICRVGQFSAL